MVLFRASLIEIPFINHNTINSVMLVTLTYMRANSKIVEALVAITINMIMYRGEIKKKINRKKTQEDF